MSLSALLAAAALSGAPTPTPPAPPMTMAPLMRASGPPAVSPHIRMVPFDPNQLVLLHGDLGFQMVVEFALDEHIENVSIGDGLAWQITPNKRANLLFLKPLDAGILTNMTVVTDQRRYAFELDAPRTAPGKRRADRTYVVHFIYPETAAPQTAAAKTGPLPPKHGNTHYSYEGGRSLVPAEVFDDGRFTYFRWAEASATPAIFALSGEGGETLVNYGVRDGYVVVEQVAPRFVLRDGKQQTTVINDAWSEPDPGPDAPRPHRARAAAEGSRP